MTLPTTSQIAALRNEAATAGDLEQHAICTLAIGGRDELEGAEPGTAQAVLLASGMTQHEARLLCAIVIDDALAA
jgi:hypothetical protein